MSQAIFKEGYRKGRIAERKQAYCDMRTRAIEEIVNAFKAFIEDKIPYELSKDEYEEGLINQD